MEISEREQLKSLMQNHGFREVAKVLSELIGEVNDVQSESSASEEPRCSFCGKQQSQVDNRIIGGPGVFICIECVNLCNRIKAEQWPDQP